METRGRWGRGTAFALVALVLLCTLVGCDLPGQTDHATTKAAAPTATPVPTSIPITPLTPPCQATQLGMQVSYVDMNDGHMGYRLSFTNSGSKVCFMQGYPTIQLNGADGPLSVPVQDATRTPTYFAAIDSVVLAPNESTPAYLYLDWALPSPADMCTSVRGITITTPGTSARANWQLDMHVCGALNVSPMIPPRSDSRPLPPSPDSIANGLPTCKASRLLLALVQTGAALGHGSAMYVLTNSSMDYRSACALNGYPTLRLMDAQGQPLPLRQINTATAYTYQEAPAGPVPLGAGESVYFYVDYGDAPQAGATCATNATTLTVTPPGSTTNLQTTDSIQPCSPINVSPLEYFWPYS